MLFTEDESDYTMTDTNNYASINTVKNDINATTESTNSSSLKVGIIEYSGIVNVNHIAFWGKNITTGGTTDTSSHANHVTNIILKFAPNAQIFVYGIGENTENSDDSSFIDALAFMSNNGVKIINVSMGWYPGGYYNKGIDGMIDYYSTLYSLTIIKSAGNLNQSEYDYMLNDYLSWGAYAHNIITVGGVERSSAHSNKFVQSASALFGLYDTKPNIVAHFSLYLSDFLFNVSGTSFSAPIVTGAVAIIVSQNIYMQSKPHAVASLLAASANKSICYQYDSTSGYANFDECYGAGFLDLGNALSNINQVYNTTVSTTPSDYVVRTIIVQISAGSTINIACYWTAHQTSNYANNSPIISDYDILIKINSQYVAMSSGGSGSNAELLTYTVNSTAYVYIEIHQISRTTTDYVSLCYIIS